jgi:divalent metal cation (Fe/Co/Zn/Cd) transporter
MAESKLAIYGAIAANVAIAATKFVVAGITGSSAMLSEGIHSSVDSFNGVLPIVGVRLCQRPLNRHRRWWTGARRDLGQFTLESGV